MENVEKLALLCAKNNLKIKLNDLYLDVLSVAWDLLDTKEEYDDFKDDIGTRILISGFDEIDNSINFNETINIFNKTIEELRKVVIELHEECVCEDCKVIEEDGPVYMGPGTDFDDDDLDK